MYLCTALFILGLCVLLRVVMMDLDIISISFWDVTNCSSNLNSLSEMKSFTTHSSLLWCHTGLYDITNTTCRLVITLPSKKSQRLASSNTFTVYFVPQPPRVFVFQMEKEQKKNSSLNKPNLKQSVTSSKSLWFGLIASHKNIFFLCVCFVNRLLLQN